ncbi:MAG: rod-binding protein [Bacteroides sp.]|nr:rod-binding protein [Bacteroides sp.]MCM1549055.1 rod-binding protein [Clostridium sp.]
MAISINDVYSNYYTQNDTGSIKASALEHKLNSNDMENATDEELLDACKEFEAYLIEQVLKEVKESIPKSEEEDNKYTEYFGDMMLQEYASLLTDRGDLGIAQTLYESMKNNMNAVNIKNVEATTEAQEVAGAAQKINM